MAAAAAAWGQLQDVCAFLENYWCRNQVFRTTQFAALMLGGVAEPTHPILAAKLSHVSNSISNMRVMLRLLDDLPGIVHTVRAWGSRLDQTVLSRCVDLLTSMCGILYYPVEHIAWAADNHLVSYQSSRLWTIGILLWAVPLVISTIRSLLALMYINKELELQWKREKSSNSSPPGDKRVSFADQKQYVGTKPRMQALMTQRFMVILAMVQSMSDLMIAVHWLPGGFLWAQKLPTFWVGLFGTMSSVIGLYKILPTQSV